MNSERKKRFGVSIDAELAEEINNLSQVLRVDRSKVIEEAVRSFLEDHRHLILPHECSGAIAALCNDLSQVSEIVKAYRSVIVSHFHMHIKDRCIDLIVVNGNSHTIGELYGELKNIGCRVRYLPFTD
jgi:CopG family nickel-responsive transcriptional regulator